MNSRTMSLLALLLAVCASPASIISLNWAADTADANQIISGAETYGVAAEGSVAGNWNNTDWTPGTLTRDDGTMSSVSLSIVSPSGFQTHGATLGNTPLYAGPMHWDTTPAGQPGFTISDLSAEFPFGYKVIVYLTGKNWAGDAWISDGATTYYYNTPNTDTTTLIKTTNTSGTGIPQANYAVFDNLNADSVTFSLDAASGGGQSIGGFQIVGLDSAPVATYYIDAVNGSDAHSGTATNDAWQTLSRAGTAYPQSYNPGDRILLKRGENFSGKLYLIGESGASDAPLVIGAYGSGARPVIDSAGYLAGIQLENCSHVTVQDLEITADGGATLDGLSQVLRYGVLADVTWGASADSITLTNLYIHNIYPELDDPSEGANPTTYKGTAIRLAGDGNSSTNFPATNIRVEDCTIERTGYKAIELQRCDVVSLLNNQMTDVGGPALQPSRCNDVTVRGNVVDGSGAYVDPRMHGRGSGIWPWGCDRVLIEGNTFMNAVGREDSCGIHIDFNCNDVVVQYNLSINNAGGFIEILGNNNNCSYRYNVSINDGWRVAGVLDQGTIPNNANGRTLFLSGWVGSQGGVPNNYSGPFNTYIYNNTIYTPPGQASHFIIHGTAQGVKICNNIFYLAGPVGTVIKGWKVNGSWTQNYQQSMIDSVVWENNLYENSDSIPTHLPFGDASPSVGDPLFTNTGGTNAADYIPASGTLVQNQGIVITNIPGDPLGLLLGLTVTQDFFGNPTVGLPDMGAIEMVVPPMLTISHALGSVTVEWDPVIGVLQSAPSVSGTWSPVATNSPHVIPATNAAAVYRVELP